MDSYQALANAIIVQAVKDFRAAYRRLRRFPNDRLADKTVQEITDFFHSGYFELLTSLDGPELLQQIIDDMEEAA